MTEPKNGDFAGYLNKLAAQPDATNALSPSSQSDRTQFQDDDELTDSVPEFLLDEQQKLSKELMREAAELDAIEPMSDEELERQALQAGGSDNDASTPE